MLQNDPCVDLFLDIMYMKKKIVIFDEFDHLIYHSEFVIVCRICIKILNN